MVENLPANAGDINSIPGPGRLWGKLSLCTTISEAWVQRASALQQEKPPHREACVLKPRAAQCSQQLEKPACSNGDPDSKKKKNHIGEGHDKDWLEPTRSKMMEYLTSSRLELHYMLTVI